MFTLYYTSLQWIQHTLCVCPTSATKEHHSVVFTLVCCSSSAALAKPCSWAEQHAKHCQCILMTHTPLSSGSHCTRPLTLTAYLWLLSYQDLSSLFIFFCDFFFVCFLVLGTLEVFFLNEKVQIWWILWLKLITMFSDQLFGLLSVEVT